MLNTYLNRPRKKAWIGAAIGAAVGIGSAIFGANQQRKAQQKQFNLQRNTQAREAGLQSAANLTQAFANYDELDREFQDRFFLYGGRKKAELGTEEENKDENKTTDDNNSSTDSSSNNDASNDSTIDVDYSSGGGLKWSNADTNAIIGSVGNAVGNIAGTLIRNNVHRSGEIFNPIKASIRPKQANEAIYDSAARSEFLNNYYRTATMRLGGNKRSRRC